MDDRERQARRSIEGFGQDDWIGMVRELNSPELVYEETGSGRRIEGIEAVLEALHAWRTGFPDIAGEVCRVVMAGDVTVLDVVWRGTHTGPLAMPAGVVPPTGRRLETRATMWQRWAGDRIVHEHHHLDMLTLLAQLGLLPVPADA